MRRSILIGINKYDTLTPLAGCVRDAQDMATLLAEPEYSFDTKLLTNDEATRRRVLDELWTAAEAAGDALLIYFAGHGGVHAGNGYLATSDGINRDPGLKLSELAHIISVAADNYPHVITILDSCHSGAGSTWTDHRPLMASAVTDSIEVVNTSRILMAACRPEQYAFEVPEPEAHGAFTKVLLDALAGDAVDFSGNVTAHGLFEAVTSRMDTEKQTPVFKGDSAGSVILGSGFPPREGAPILAREKATLLAKAERLIDEYHLAHTHELARTEHRRSVGLAVCSRKLSEVIRWFNDSEERDADLKRDAAWKSFRHSLNNYQEALAALGVGDRLTFGLIERRVGGGGFGDVWEVAAEASPNIAYKVFHGSELSDKLKVDRFRNGYHSMKALDHPRIVAVDELTEAPLGFTMDLIDGADLRDSHIDRGDASSMLRIATDIADTVRYAHGVGVIHRDIKPENVIMEWNRTAENFTPILTDFDLAYIETNRTVTTNMVGGVVNYAAPEQFFASNSAAARAATVDVYAIGQLLYFIFVGSDPVADRRETNYPRLEEAVSSVLSYESAGIITDLYQRATQFNPSKRIQEMDEVFDALTRARIVHEALAGRTSFLPEEVCRQVAYAYVGSGDFTSEGERVDFQSRAGTLAVNIRPRGAGSPESYDFEISVSSSHNFGVPGASSGSRARAILNQRLDKRLKKFDNVERRAGNQGSFQTHIRVFRVPLSVDGVAKVSDVLSSTIAAIEQLD